ncbi:MAG: hypothetical protein JNK05_08690 [Myxococcales bacterium]|nr:hypothetical protein [Myxococcales bacterium]
MHDTSGAVRETRELTADGGVVRGYGAIATDGGAIAYGQAGAGSVHGAVVRLGPDGQVRWSVLAPHRPAESCRPRERVCTWSEFHHAIEVGGSVYASLNFHRGSVTFANGTRLRGDRGTLNRAIVRIDARTGVVSQVMPLRGTEYELLASGGRLSALQTTRDGSRLLQEIVRFDPALRRLSSSRVRAPHSFSSVFALGDGVATVARRDTNEWALTIIDGAGRTTWEHTFDSASVFETSGDLLFVATPLASSTDQHPLESAPRDGIARGVQVVAYDAAGRAQWSASTSHSFVRRSLGLSVSGPRSVRLTGVRLGGPLAPGAAATLVALPLLPASAAALPGALRTSLRTSRSPPSTTRTTASATPSRSRPSELDSGPQTRMRPVASRLSDRHIESKRR